MADSRVGKPLGDVVHAPPQFLSVLFFERRRRRPSIPPLLTDKLAHFAKKRNLPCDPKLQSMFSAGRRCFWP
jgi:hypothetical protein